MEKYNDDIVTSVINFKEEIIDYAMPDILFYQKLENNSSLTVFNKGKN